MAFIQISLPAPAGNGAGAAVDVSALGALKTITVTKGGDGVLEPIVIVEVSNQASPTKWAPLATFAPDGEESIEVAVRWMRATVQNFRGGNAPVVEVGAEDDGTTFATIVAPAGNGTGAGVDVSSLPSFKTVQVTGPFQGTVNIEISEDAGTTYQTILSFPSGQSGIQSANFAAEYMRVTRNGVPLIDPGLPTINVGACATGGGGGIAGIIVENSGVELGEFTTLNFTEGVQAEDEGGGVAKISATGNKQVFRYTTDGTEPNPMTIPLPSARASANYNVAATYGGGGSLKVIAPLVSTFTTTEFQVSLSAAPEEAEVYMFTVEDLT